MTGHSGSSRPRFPTRRFPSAIANADSHAGVDDQVATVIDRLGQLARGLNICGDESDARVYGRRVCATLMEVTLPVAGRVLDELGGDSGRHRSMSARVTAVQTIVTSVAYWGR